MCFINYFNFKFDCFASSYRKNEENMQEFKLLKSYILTFGAMPFSRGWDTEPISVRGKIAFLSIMIGGTLVYWHWEAMLISFLTSRTTALPFNTIEQLVKSMVEFCYQT